MSRIGKAPIVKPENVKVTFSPPNLTVEGPKGSLQMSVLDSVNVELDESQIRVSADRDEPQESCVSGADTQSHSEYGYGRYARFHKVVGNSRGRVPSRIESKNPDTECRFFESGGGFYSRRINHRS